VKVLRWLIVCLATLIVCATSSFARKSSTVDNIYRAYDGTAKPQNEVAVVKIKACTDVQVGTNPNGITDTKVVCANLSQIDGHSILRYWDGTPRPADTRSSNTWVYRGTPNRVSVPSMIELPPGKHTFLFAISSLASATAYDQGQQSSETREVVIDVMAGNKYLIEYKNNWCPAGVVPVTNESGQIVGFRNRSKREERCQNIESAEVEKY